MSGVLNAPFVSSARYRPSMKLKESARQSLNASRGLEFEEATHLSVLRKISRSLELPVGLYC